MHARQMQETGARLARGSRTQPPGPRGLARSDHDSTRERGRVALAACTMVALGDLRARLLSKVSEICTAAAPLAATAIAVTTKVFHYAFIPAVILLGMRSEPRPKLIDLLTPM